MAVETNTETPELAQLIASITPAVYQSLKYAVETGRWENGMPLTPAQKSHCLQAIIAWEHKHLPEAERTGFLPPRKPTACDHDGAEHAHERDEIQPLRFER